MRYIERPPCARLQPYVESLWLLEGRSDAPEPVFPDGCPEIVIHYGDRFDMFLRDGTRERQGRVLACGQLRTGIWLRPTGYAGVVGARLHPAALRDLTGISGKDLDNTVADCPELFPDELLEQLAENANVEQRLRTFEDALCARLQPRNTQLVRRAVALIAAQGGNVPLSTISRELMISSRTIERRFSEEVGLTPKEYSRVLRFRHAAAVLREAPAADAALATGFFDQSHLIRDFHEFAGCTPRQYLAGEYRFGLSLSHFSNTPAHERR